MSISAMKEALEALEDAAELLSAEDYSTVFQEEAITALRQAIAEAEKQVPVAWHEPGAHGNVTTHKDWALANGWEPLYAAPVHAIDISQERVDETAKRKHKWVGLTDEAIWLEYQHLWPFHPAEEPTLAKDIAKFARAIEAKLKEKNNGNTN